uniref:Large ribosomal subunit protein uL4c n=1 Tax=Ahnfeltia plicata TaxID=28023 RepID=A0A1C9CBF3_9FLOR|nr:ribosomal protein L4 [Ahnfeltia plicata]AOM65689.1 ribosomal protein L4 [Ahnfeltia plicata]UAT97188.1 ribosomal protein L4 [Ahnfeltia plicata]UAT97393.1 ribosomal protein L4 [Ahnfeltia plicata]
MAIEKQLEYPVYTMTGTVDETKKINLKICDINGMYVVHRALIKQLSQKRQGNASCKTRSEVRGGGRKPWKQKGTGRARVGSTRSPLWRGGGVIFGPKPRIYTKKINKKEKQLALRTLFYNKLRNTILVSDFHSKIEKPKTQLIIESLKIFRINSLAKVLIIVQEKNANLYLSTRNLKNVEIIAASQINILSLLKADKLIITLDALNKIQEVYNA